MAGMGARAASACGRPAAGERIVARACTEQYQRQYEQDFEGLHSIPVCAEEHAIEY